MNRTEQRLQEIERRARNQEYSRRLETFDTTDAEADVLWLTRRIRFLEELVRRV